MCLHPPKKPPNSTWTYQREVELRKMYHEKKSIKLMVERFELTHASIKQKLQRMGLMYEKREGPTPKQLMVIEVLKEMGIYDRLYG